MLAATVSVTTTKAALYDLLAGAGLPYRRVQEGFAELQLENNPAEANNVFIGDQAVTTTNFGAALYGGTVKDQQKFGHDSTDLNTRGIYLISSAGTVPVHVWIR